MAIRLTTVCATLVLAINLSLLPAESRDASVGSWPFKHVAPVWHNMMTAKSGSLIVNDRSVEHPTLREQKRLAADKTFRKAVEDARNEHRDHPIDDILITVLCNLASFDYSIKNYEESASLFREALETAERANNQELAEDILEDLASTYRGLNDFEKAEKAYQKCLQLRKTAAGHKHPHTAMTHTRLGNLAHDRLKDADASAHETAAHSSIDGKEFISVKLTPNVLRPLPTSGLSKPVDYLTEMLAESDNISRALSSRQLSRQQEELARREAGERARLAKFLEDEKKRAALLAKLNGLADNSNVEQAPGFADIAGCFVPDVTSGLEFTLTKKFQSTKTINPKAEDPDAEKSLPPFELVLCNRSVREALARTIINHAQIQGSDLKDLGTTWPRTQAQARELMIPMAKTVLEHKLKRSQDTLITSNEKGEFVFSDVPKGAFYIYAHIGSNKEYVYWLIPIIVSDKKRISIDLFAKNVSHCIWKENRALNATQQ